MKEWKDLLDEGKTHIHGADINMIWMVFNQINNGGFRQVLDGRMERAGHPQNWLKIMIECLDKTSRKYNCTGMANQPCQGLRDLLIALDFVSDEALDYLDTAWFCLQDKAIEQMMEQAE